MFPAVKFATILNLRESQPQENLMILSIIESYAAETVSLMAPMRAIKCEAVRGRSSGVVENSDVLPKQEIGHDSSITDVRQCSHDDDSIKAGNYF